MDEKDLKIIELKTRLENAFEYGVPKFIGKGWVLMWLDGGEVHAACFQTKEECVKEYEKNCRCEDRAYLS